MEVLDPASRIALGLPANIVRVNHADTGQDQFAAALGGLSPKPCSEHTESPKPSSLEGRPEDNCRWSTATGGSRWQAAKQEPEAPLG